MIIIKLAQLLKQASTTNDHKREQATTSDRKPPAIDHKPETKDHNLPKNNYKQPANNHKLTTSNNKRLSLHVKRKKLKFCLFFPQLVVTPILENIENYCKLERLSLTFTVPV